MLMPPLWVTALGMRMPHTSPANTSVSSVFRRHVMWTLVGQNPTKTTGGFVDFDDSRISDKIGAQAKDRKLEPHEGLGR